MKDSPPPSPKSIGSERSSPACRRRTPSAVVSQCAPPAVETPSMIVLSGGLSSALSLIGYLDSFDEPRPFRLQEAEGVGEDLTRGAWEGSLRPLGFHDGCDSGLELSQPAAQRLVVGALRDQHQVGQSDQDRMRDRPKRSEDHTSELQSLMRISYAVFCLKKKKKRKQTK